MAKTYGQELVENFPDEFEPDAAESIDKDLSDRLLDPKRRKQAIADLSEYFDYSPNAGTDALEGVVLMDFFGRKADKEKESRLQSIEEMKEQASFTQEEKANKLFEKADVADDEIRRPGDPSYTDKVFQQAYTPDEVAEGDFRVRNTFKTWEEAKEISAKNPESRIMTDGVKVWVIDKDKNTIAQGRDDFVSYDPSDVNFSADSMLGRGGQALLGAVTGAGDPLQQAVAGSLGAGQRGMGFPELGQKRGREAGQAAADVLDIRPVADASLKVASGGAEALGDANYLWSRLKAGMMSTAPRRGGRVLNDPPTPQAIQAVRDQGDADRAEYQRKAKSLAEGIPDGPSDPEANRELGGNLGEEMGNVAGNAAQMMSPTGGVKVIANAIAPLVKGAGNVARSVMASPTIGISDAAPKMSSFHDAPSIMAVKNPGVRDALEEAMQTRRTAADVYAQDTARSIGDGADPIWKDLQPALADPDEMVRVRAKYPAGEAGSPVDSAMERLMSVRKGIQNEFAPKPVSAPHPENIPGAMSDLPGVDPEAVRSMAPPVPPPPPDFKPFVGPVKPPWQPMPEMKQQKLLDVPPTPKPLQGETWTGGRLSDIRPSESWESAKKRVFATKAADEAMTAREKDLLAEKLDNADALTTTAETARAEFNAAGGPVQQQMRSIHRFMNSGEIPSDSFGGWLSRSRKTSGGAAPAVEDFKFIDEAVQSELKSDNKALLLVGDGARELPTIANEEKSRRAVFKVPSTGSSELDAAIHGKVVDRPIAQSIYQMSRSDLPSHEAQATAKAWDDLLATSATKETLTRGNPGFDPFQRSGEIVRALIDSPGAMSDGSREMVADYFLGKLDPKISEKIRRGGSIGYGRTAEVLKLADKPQLLPGETFVRNQEGVANKVYRGIHGARDAMMVPGKASSAVTDSMVRSLFPNLPAGVSGEDAIRVWHSLSLMLDGVPATQAIQQTNRLFVNFAQVNRAQAKTAPFVLFVKWQSAAIQGALDAAMRNPEKYRHLYDFMRMAETMDAQNHGAPVSAKAKESWQNFAGIPAVQIGNQLSAIKTPGPLSEVVDISEMMVNTWRSFKGAPPSGPTVAGLLHPLIQGGAAVTTGKNWATGRAFGLANKDVGENAYKMPEHIPGTGLFGIAKMQRDDPERFPPDALLGRNPELAAAVEYAGALGMSAIPPYALDAARVGLGRTSPWRLDPESQEFYKLRKGLQYGAGARITPLDSMISSMSRAQQLGEEVPVPPETLLRKQSKKGRIPEETVSDPNSDLARMIMERIYGRGSP